MGIVPWLDDAPDPGFDPRSAYAERFWTPVLGPSTLLLHRHIIDLMTVDPDGFLLDLRDAAARLGLGDRTTRNGPFGRSLVRLVRFRQAQVRKTGVLAVRTTLPPVSPRVLARLPRSIQIEHAVTAVRAGLVCEGARWVRTMDAPVTDSLNQGR